MICLALLYVGCTDLEVEELDSVVVEDENLEFDGDAGALLRTAYNQLAAFTNQANVYALYEHTSDELLGPTRGTDWGDNGVWRLLHTHQWDENHQYVRDAWNEMNGRAYVATQVLASRSPAPTAQQAAEAKFLRAFYTWHVMDLFGQVPFRDVNADDDVNPEVFSRTRALDFILTDLREALPDLPSTGPATDNTRASKAAANALLARIYLNRGVYTADVNEQGAINVNFDPADMNVVVEAVDAIIADGYGLEDDYFDIYTAASQNEVILASPQGSAENRYFMTLHYDHNPSGWNGFTTLADFYATFEEEDVRKGINADPDSTAFSGIGRGFLIGQQFDDSARAIINSRSGMPLSYEPEVPIIGADTDDGIRAIKYHPEDKGNYILLRYGDVHLMKAEALFRLGNTAEALALVNELRTARGASALGSLDENALLEERGRELYWEGYRRLDQIRFGTFTSNTWEYKEVTDPYRVLFPIPQQALDSNPNLVQNPGY